MTNEASSTPNGHDVNAAGDGDIAITAHWEKPLVAPAGGEATLLVRVVAPTSVETARRAPLDVAFVLDRSGSMQGGKLDLAKEGVSLAIGHLRDADRAALVVYDNAVDTVQPLAATTPRLKASLRLALPGIDPGGSTFLSGGWMAGCRELAEAPPAAGKLDGPSRLRRVMLLTDGLANVGVLDAGELAQHAGGLRQRGIATTTLGVGEDFDEGLLSAMAEAGGGNFQYVADPEALRKFFTQELQELFTIVATELTIDVKLPPGVAAELISAFPVEARGDAVAVAVGDVAAGDEIDLVFALTVAPGALGDRLPVTIGATWTDPRLDERRYGVASTEPLRRAEQSAVDGALADAHVAERAALQRAAAARRAGLELDRQGRFAESRARMAQARDYLMAAPMTESVRFDLQDASFLAEASPTVAFRSHLRKSVQHREDQRRRGRLGRVLSNREQES